MLITELYYDLPNEKIALFPLENRTESKLLVCKKSGCCEESQFKHIETFLKPEALLVLNNSKVIPARIIIENAKNKPIEVFCLEPSTADPNGYGSLLNKGSVYWNCILGNAKKWLPKTTLISKFKNKDTEIELSLFLIEKHLNYAELNLSWTPENMRFEALLQMIGKIPLPPYIKRASIPEDVKNYQTIFSVAQGSVAAPTAGLHFTQALLEQLLANNFSIDYVTLHVGAGTFKPIRAPQLEDHLMHQEPLDISVTTLENIIAHLGNIVAVGTTSLRTLETLYWLGLKLYNLPNLSTKELVLNQDDTKILSKIKLSATDSLAVLLAYLKSHRLQTLVSATQLYILPGYSFKIVNGLVTNFHQPGSSLLGIISAINDSWRNFYNYALTHDFRFLSFGDVCYFELD